MSRILVNRAYRLDAITFIRKKIGAALSVLA